MIDKWLYYSPLIEPHIINQYKNNISKIISEPDQGIYDAMNKGISHSTGDFLYFLNAGDKLFSNKTLSNIANFYQKNPNVDIIYGDVKLSNLSIKWTVNKITNKGIIKNKKYLFINMFCQQRAFFNKIVFNKLGFLDTSYKIIADYDIIFKAYSTGMNFEYLNEPIAIIPLGGFSNIHMNQFLLERLRSLKNIPLWNWWWIIIWAIEAIFRGSLKKYILFKIKH